MSLNGKGVNQVGQPLLTFSCETTYATNLNIVPFHRGQHTGKHETFERSPVMQLERRLRPIVVLAAAYDRSSEK